jgi:PBP1b-binding outer membrane lipoprotein LpoB
MRLCRRYSLAVMILMVFLFSGCRGNAPVHHVNPNVDFSFFKRVAVMPLDNLTNDRSAGDIIRQVVISELLASGVVDVVIPGEVMAAINNLGIQNITSLSKKEINALGKALNVEAVIMGSVDQYGHIRSGNVSAPEVTISLMMAEVETGNIIWSITLTRGGASFWTRHFGTKSMTISETVQTVVREAVRTLAGY